MLPVPPGAVWEHQCGHLPSHLSHGGPGATARVGAPLTVSLSLTGNVCYGGLKEPNRSESP